MGAPWRRWGCGWVWRSRQRRCPRRFDDRRGHLCFVSTAGQTIRPPAQIAVPDVLNLRRAFMNLREKNKGVVNRTTGLRSLLAVVLSAGIVASCATQSVTQTQEPLAAGEPRVVRIEPCEDRTGFSGGRDLKGEATRTFVEKVKAAKLFEVTTDASLVLTCDIERFAEGSALKRWVMPGWGPTQAAVSVMVWKKPEEKVLATFRSQSSVSAGGLYTIGADQYILGVAFDDIVKQLGEWAKGATPEGKP